MKKKALPKTAEAAKLSLRCGDSRAAVATVELTAAEFSRIQDAVSQRSEMPIERVGLSAFIREALLENANRELFPGRPMIELEDAVAQAAGLMRLALEHQACREEEQGNAYGRKCSQELVILCHATTGRLWSAFDAAFSYIAGKPAA